MQKKFIELAIKEAVKALKKGEVPVGAIIIKNGKIIAKAHNLVEKRRNATFHAEILAMTKASRKTKNWRLNDCEMYVTLEPCKMCAAAIELSRIKKVYYLLPKDKENIFINKEKYIFLKDYKKDSLDLIHSFFKKIR